MKPTWPGATITIDFGADAKNFAAFHVVDSRFEATSKVIAFQAGGLNGGSTLDEDMDLDCLASVAGKVGAGYCDFYVTAGPDGPVHGTFKITYLVF